MYITFYQNNVLKFLCFLIWQDDDAVNAEVFINKASFLVSGKHEVLNLQYKVTRRFILVFELMFEKYLCVANHNL